MPAMTLQYISDRIEIDDLLTRYATALDTKDWDLFSSCFTPDAILDYTSVGGIKGKLAEVRAWLTEVMDDVVMSQHLITNREVEIDGDSAVCRSYLFNPTGLADEDDELVVVLEGGYAQDKLVRTPDGWRIAERVEDPAYSTRLHRVLIQPVEV